ncbi:hypothetical protein [Kordia sp.]|uniref:hypothetical protein n=1 Tax=Kordia sp. TaxID=1965332 RepID=UPI003B5BE599
MRIVLFLFLTFAIHTSVAQTDFNAKIIGKWEFVKATTDSTKVKSKSSNHILDKNAEDPFMKRDILLSFRDEQSIVFEIENFLMEASYSLKNSLLNIGKYQYTILKVTNDSLHFKAKNTHIPTYYTYKKSHK